MSGQKKVNLGSRQAQWARFRFSVIGVLLSAPPKAGELKAAIEDLANKQWQHPFSGEYVRFSFSTIERWFYQARKTSDPIKELRSKIRANAGLSSGMNAQLKQLIQQQYREHCHWSYQLHFDNLKVLVKKASELGSLPSYNTVHRYMKANGLVKQRRVRARHTTGAMLAAERLEKREVRSFEVEHVHALWHLDFHEGSLAIIGRDGKWYKPQLLAIIDDHSRLICHVQWYLNQTTETLVHGVTQALQKRGLPRSLMSDNGAAMVASEFTDGLAQLSIVHDYTLPYSPYQNAKQEVFWCQIEGRLLCMLEGETELSLAKLNEATIAWLELEYHRKLHSEIGTTPLERYLKAPNVGRDCPETKVLREAFCMQVNRKQRRSDGSFSLEGKRFEIPSQYRHLDKITIRYARWDLSKVLLINAQTDQVIAALYPQDKAANASGYRREHQNPKITSTPATDKPSGSAPLLKELMAEYAATGRPPSYITKHEDK